MAKNQKLLLLAILLLALILRLWGIKWGLPTPRHLYSYHPDETTILGALTNIDIFQLKLNPHFFNYGTLYIYLVALGVTFASGLGLINPQAANISSLYAHMLLTARLITVCLGVATVYFTYLIGKRAYNLYVGLLAALLISILPLHAIHSHYATVDVPATFFITMAMFFAIQILNSGKNIWYILAGLSAGFAAATKYNSAMVILSIILAHLLKENKLSQLKHILVTITDKRLLGACIFMLLGFLVGCPYSTLAWHEFKGAFLFEWQHVHSGHGYLFTHTGNGWCFHLKSSLNYAMGLPILIICLTGTVYALVKHNPPNLVILAWLIPYYLIIGSWQVRFMRYTIPLLPFMAILGMSFWHDLYIGLKNKWPTTKIPFYALTFLLFGYLLISVFAYDNLMTQKDNRTNAAEWVNQNVTNAKSIGLTQIPWFFTPPISPYNAGKLSEPEFQTWQNNAKYKIFITNWDTAELTKAQPDYFIISEFEYLDPLRIKEPQFMRFWQQLNSKYRIIKEFANQPTFINWRFAGKSPPHDWLYPYPKVLIYKRL